MVSTAVSGLVSDSRPRAPFGPERNQLHDLTTWTLAPESNWAEARTSAHFVQFYDIDNYLLDAVADFITSAIDAGGTGVVVATPQHLDGLRSRFEATGLDLSAAQQRGHVLALGAEATLAQFMVGGQVDDGCFGEVIGGIVSRAGMGGRRVCVFGEMVALLAAAGNHPAAVQLEQLWNELQRTVTFSLFCAYPMQQFSAEGTRQLLEEICAEHVHVIPAESYAALATQDDRLRAITILQQQARRLETEIVDRQRAEEQLRAALAAEQVARRDAKAALRVRDEFLAIAAHELRTPRTGLSGHAQLMLRQLRRDGQLEAPRIEQALEAIAGQADKLSRLLNQLLDISRLDSGKLAIERQPTDVVAFVEQVVAAA